MSVPAATAAVPAADAAEAGPDPQVILIQNFFEILNDLLPAD